MFPSILPRTFGSSSEALRPPLRISPETVDCLSTDHPGGDDDDDLTVCKDVVHVLVNVFISLTRCFLWIINDINFVYQLISYEKLIEVESLLHCNS